MHYDGLSKSSSTSAYCFVYFRRKTKLWYSFYSTWTVLLWYFCTVHIFQWFIWTENNLIKVISHIFLGQEKCSYKCLCKWGWKSCMCNIRCCLKHRVDLHISILAVLLLVCNHFHPPCPIFIFCFILKVLQKCLYEHNIHEKRYSGCFEDWNPFLLSRLSASYT